MFEYQYSREIENQLRNGMFEYQDLVDTENKENWSSTQYFVEIENQENWCSNTKILSRLKIKKMVVRLNILVRLSTNTNLLSRYNYWPAYNGGQMLFSSLIINVISDQIIGDNSSHEHRSISSVWEMLADNIIISYFLLKVLSITSAKKHCRKQFLVLYLDRFLLLISY